ncbi:phage tail protein [Paucilactobacillus sp. N302-9]
MAIVGLKMVSIAAVDPLTQKLVTGIEAGGLSEDGVVQIDSTMFGTKTANITNLEGAATKVDGNNATQDVIIGPASPAVAFDFNNLNWEVLQAALGNKSDGKGGFQYQGTKPHIAVLIKTQSLDRKQSIYYGFANGIMSKPSQNIATDTSTAQTRQDDNITYTALGANAWDGQPVKTWNSGTTGFDEPSMLKEVFGGFAGTLADDDNVTPKV